MHPIIKNILAVVAGLVVGSVVNMAIIMCSEHLIAPPEGADVTTIEGLKASMHLFEPRHFVMPFLAHALGTLAGALVAYLLAATQHLRLAIAIGVIFLVGGITNIILLPSPLWFSILDTAGAYIPMSFLATKIATKLRS